LKKRKLLKKKYIFLFATSFSGLFLNNFAEATVLNNSYKEVIDHVWQIVYRDFLDSSGKFQKSNWINLRKEVLSKTYSDSNEAYDAIRDMLSNLDDSYTRFLEPKEFNQMRIDTSGELTGIGIQIVKDKESDDLIIISPIEGTPAFDAGIKARDKILSIDDISTEGMNIEDAVILIRGQRGTKVKLEILRGSQSFFKTLTREKMQSLVLKIWKETGKTIILITHSVEEALLLGEKVYVMAPRPGRIHKEYNLPFASMGLKEDLRVIKNNKEFVSKREEILSMIWDMEEEIMGKEI